MIIVTGTKRSGTSMWMQVLQAAGLAVIGEAFPLNWQNTLRDANPAGFYESLLRKGIYWETNPYRGHYLDPESTRLHAVKVFIPGLIRTDRAFIHRVLGTMRHWREYDASVRRLYALGARASQDLGVDASAAELQPYRVDPILEWWAENFSLISDVVTRRYPVHLTAYEETLRDPERVVSEAVRWLGSGNASKAVAVVKAETRTQVATQLENAPLDISTSVQETFDALYEHVLERRPLQPSFLGRLNDVHAELLPRIEEAMKSAMLHERDRRRRARETLAARKRGEGRDADDPVPTDGEGDQPGA